MKDGIWPLIVWSLAVLAFTAFVFWLTRNYWMLWFVVLTFRWVYSNEDEKS
jgi:hypothetical protein